MDVWDVALAFGFYALGRWHARRDSQRQVDELKDFIDERLAYDETVFSELARQGKLNSADVQILGGGIPSEEAFGEATISVGPPPTPPRIVEAAAHARGRSSLRASPNVTRPDARESPS